MMSRVAHLSVDPWIGAKTRRWIKRKQSREKRAQSRSEHPFIQQRAVSPSAGWGYCEDRPTHPALPDSQTQTPPPPSPICRVLAMEEESTEGHFLPWVLMVKWVGTFKLWESQQLLWAPPLSTTGEGPRGPRYLPRAHLLPLPWRVLPTLNHKLYLLLLVTLPNPAVSGPFLGDHPSQHPTFPPDPHSWKWAFPSPWLHPPFVLSPFPVSSSDPPKQIPVQE